MTKTLNRKLLQHTLLVIGSYTMISVVWIIFSDNFVATFFDDAYQMQVQSYKGIAFVFFTSIFLVLLISRKNSSIKSYMEIPYIN